MKRIAGKILRFILISSAIIQVLSFPSQITNPEEDKVGVVLFTLFWIFVGVTAWQYGVLFKADRQFKEQLARKDEQRYEENV